jgi:hypothetical protein
VQKSSSLITQAAVLGSHCAHLKTEPLLAVEGAGGMPAGCQRQRVLTINLSVVCMQVLP